MLPRRSGGRRSSTRVVTLVTREGCHLCAQAAPLVQAEAARAGVTYETRDVDAREPDRRAYGNKVPVVLLDGIEHAFWQVDYKALRAALRR